MVGCDGANSFVRKAMGLDFKGRTFEEDWLVVDVKDAPRPIDHVEFHCDPARPAPDLDLSRTDVRDAEDVDRVLPGAPRSKGDEGGRSERCA